ncbi:cobalt ECF transporter T component CbiQ [Companilactobacillus ginsenosidimutans]|uniref:Cobalt ABC transporter permease n=1 Tax=Companilactobacillus ginsenosidimutans TaxID=1007676 RepID=A0A0H4QXK8_9LACO|nr:cobalt ECF transporter T component CbiQ [Companilactobacillus ginsenosidimutans]AKP66220.1 cobalt ABC transporter permease [Companilactobacillus ginsenosidimutans]
MLVIDKYAYENRIATYNAWWKILVFIIGLVGAFQPIIWLKFLTMLVISTITIYVTEVSVHRYLKWFYPILPFLILSIIGIVVTVAAKQSVMFWSIPVGSSYLGISKVTLHQGLVLGVQALTAIVCTYFLALTTPFQQLMKVLLQLHLPKLFVEQTMLIYRFIFIFLDECMRIFHAQQLRLGYSGFKNSLESVSILLKMLFMQVMIKYEAMQNSLEMKLFNGDFDLK